MTSASTGDKAIDYVLDHLQDVQAVVELWDLTRKRAPGILFERGRDAIREWEGSAARPRDVQVVDLVSGSENCPCWRLDGWTEDDPFFVWDKTIDFGALARGEPRALATALSLVAPCKKPSERQRATAWSAFVKSRQDAIRASATNVVVLPEGDEIGTRAEYFPLLGYQFGRVGAEILRDPAEFARVVREAVDDFTRRAIAVLREGPAG